MAPHAGRLTVPALGERSHRGLYLVLRRRGLLVRPPIPRSPIGWRADRPREFLQTYRPRRAANHCDRGGAASAAPRIRGEGRAQSLPTPVELYEPHAVQRIMRVRALFSSARIRTTPQFPHVYSLVGLAASSTGGALATAETASGSGMSLSLLCGRAGIISSQ
jgi:hypothetical protein